MTRDLCARQAVHRTKVELKPAGRTNSAVSCEAHLCLLFSVNDAGPGSGVWRGEASLWLRFRFFFCFFLSFLLPPAAS